MSLLDVQGGQVGYASGFHASSPGVNLPKKSKNDLLCLKNDHTLQGVILK